MNQARIQTAIEETKRYIEREEKRNADTRPVAVSELLAKYKLHLIKLESMLKA